MHWVLDVSENNIRKRVSNVVKNYSRMMKVVLNLLRYYMKKRNKIVGQNERTIRKVHRSGGGKNSFQSKKMLV